MDVWIIFDLLPTGPVYDAGQPLRKALQRVPPAVALASLPALKAAVESFEAEDITLVEGLGQWLRALDVSDDVKAQIDSFLTIAQQHPKAIERALAPVLDDLDTFLP